MIYVDVKGNLGNQMFEYAFARFLQEKTGQDICLNTCWLKKYREDMTFSLNNFSLNDRVFIENNREMPWYTNTYAGIIRALKGVFPDAFYSIMKHFGAMIYIKEKYKEIPIKKNFKDYYLAGYWQCDKYFDGISDVIRKEFQPIYDRLECNKELYEIIEGNESICVTVRCGDYMTNEKVRLNHLICTSDFYEEGVRRIKQEHPDAVVCVFSDDVEWCKASLNFGEKVYYESGEDPVWEKLRMMSLCKHFVISNSSFSWWAQYLSLNDSKIVYAPRFWYPDKRECDIYQENWRYIDV